MALRLSCDHKADPGYPMDYDAVTFVVFLEFPAFHLEAYDFFHKFLGVLLFS